MRNPIKNTFLVLALACLVAPGLVQASNGPTPKPLAERVRHELVMLPYYGVFNGVFDDLSFQVDGSTVTLYGQVVQPVLKSDAGNAVKRLSGVTQVINHIEVLPLSPFDNQIRWATLRAIYGYWPLQRYGLGTQPSIHIIVDNGHVTLKGYVDSQADRNIAGLRANSVPGVFSVTNDLHIS